MRRRLCPLLLVVILSSCSSFPAENFVFDLAASDVPIMITPIDITERAMDFNYQSGYSSEFMTVTTGYGNYTSSTTITHQSDLGQPLSEQVKAITYAQPAWVVVRALTLKVDEVESVSSGKASYVLSLDVTAPLTR